MRLFLPLLLVLACSQTLPAAQRPNVLFLLTDDQRFDTLGAMGNEVIQTPHIDSLAARGTLFTNAFCTTSICMISRASYLTGQYERRHGISSFRQALSPQAWQSTWPARLKAEGYRIGFIGKWGLGNPLPEKEYDYWGGYLGQGRYYEQGDDEHLTDKHARQALEFLDGCSDRQPFCLQVSFKAAHCQDGEPWQTQFPPAERYLSLYKDVKAPVPPTATLEDFAALPDFLQDSEARNRWKVRFADSDMHQYTVKNYYRLLTGVDDTVGRLLEKLKQRGLADNTVIVYTSDNGFYLGDRGLAGKWYAHEESIRLPLLIYDPRSGQGRTPRCQAMVLNIDVAPTILDYAGIKAPQVMQGRSLRPLAEGETPAGWREDFLYEHRFNHARIPMSEGVRGERWKYVRYPQHDTEELFDLQADPLERNDLSGKPQHAKTLAEMRRRHEELAAAAQ